MAASVAAFAASLSVAGAATVLPDGSMRFDYGRKPNPALTCRPQYVCDISLDSGENVLNMAIGDNAHWVIASAKSGPGGSTPQVFVKPTQLNLETNLVITTTKRVYDIALRSSNAMQHPRITFAYPEEEAASADAQRAAIESVLAGNPAVGLDKADLKYKVSGDSALVPERVFNDGTRTFIAWKTLPAQLPSVVVPVAAASETPPPNPAPSPGPLNFRVVGNGYIIDGLQPAIDLIWAADPDRHGRPERRVTIRHQ